jgi:hypothetical protein
MECARRNCKQDTLPSTEHPPTFVFTVLWSLHCVNGTKEAFSEAPDSANLGRYLNAHAGVLWLRRRGDAHHRWAERRREILRLRVPTGNPKARFPEELGTLRSE